MLGSANQLCITVGVLVIFELGKHLVKKRFGKICHIRAFSTINPKTGRGLPFRWWSWLGRSLSFEVLWS